MNKKQRYNALYMDIASRVAEMSYAQRLKVGAVIVKDNRIISMGYNGMPAGWDNVCEYETEHGELKTKPEVLHAESNAISKLARSTESGEGADLFITHAPCIDCAKMVLQAGIKTVYYKTEYRSTDGVEFLKKSGIDIEKITNE